MTDHPSPDREREEPHETTLGEEAVRDRVPSGGGQSRSLDATGEIVVGIDGSEQSNLALEWATHEAQRRGASIVLLHAMEIGGYADTGVSRPPPSELTEIARRCAAALLVGAAHRVELLAPAIRVTAEYVPTTAATAPIAALRRKAIAETGAAMIARPAATIRSRRTANGMTVQGGHSATTATSGRPAVSETSSAAMTNASFVSSSKSGVRSTSMTIGVRISATPSRANSAMTAPPVALF